MFPAGSWTHGAEPLGQGVQMETFKSGELRVDQSEAVDHVSEVECDLQWRWY